MPSARMVAAAIFIFGLGAFLDGGVGRSMRRHPSRFARDGHNCAGSSFALPPSTSISAPKRLAPKNEIQLLFQRDSTCPDLARKIFRFGFDPNQPHPSRTPPHAEGRIAIVTDVEAGSGGRARSQYSLWECGRTIASRTAKPRGPGAPTLALNSQVSNEHCE
jgi:hypothetical protein